jgi:hypothetical protein
MGETIKLNVKTAGQFADTAQAGDESDLHRGKIVEYIVRRNPVGISEISRKLVISRRTLYKWFENEKLGMNDIIKIGFAINYDFSNEFPIGICKYTSKVEVLETEFSAAACQKKPIFYWMEKYIKLLEQYNEILNCKLHETENERLNKNAP